MQQKISMDFVMCNSEDRISLDEIVLAVSSAYEDKAFAELLTLILSMIQEIVNIRYSFSNVPLKSGTLLNDEVN